MRGYILFFLLKLLREWLQRGDAMTAAEMILHHCICFPTFDGGAIVVSPFGDAVEGKSGNGWSAVDISHVRRDGKSLTLCGVIWNSDRVVVHDFTRKSNVRLNEGRDEHSE